MAFRPKKKVLDQDVKRAIIANSVTLTVGDLVQPAATGHNKFITPAATTGLILGVVVAIEQDGKVCEKTSVTTGASNESTVVYRAVYIPSYIDMEYEADLSAAAGTTSNSDGLCFLSLGSGTPGTLDETSVALFGGTAGQVWSYGPTATSTTKVNCHIYKTL